MSSKTENLIHELELRGPEGLSLDELVAFLDYNEDQKANVHKFMYLVRKRVDVIYDRDRSVYLLRKHSDRKNSGKNRPNQKKYYETILCGVKRVRADAKKARIYLALKSAGSKGLSVAELQEVSDSKPQNILYLIHALRKECCVKIQTKSRRYIYKGEKSLPESGSGVTRELQKSVAPATVESRPVKEHELRSSLEQVVAELGNVKILRKIEYLHGTELADYFTMLKKALYYKSCAAKLIETNELFYNAKQEVFTNAE